MKDDATRLPESSEMFFKQPWENLMMEDYVAKMLPIYSISDDK